MKVRPSNVYLIKIHKPLAYMDPKYRTQWALKGPGERFYINRGAAGGISISTKRVTILAQGILYFK